MHPAFYVVDHRIGRHDTVPLEEKRVTRRGQPERLRLELPAPATPLVHYAPVTATAPVPPQAERASWLARLFSRTRFAPSI